ncbi:hypothetical protein D3C87_503060 [compost metagenome]
MDFSNGEKLIIMMLADLSKALKVDGDIDVDFVSDAITSGNTWALQNKYTGVFHGEDASDAIVRKVHDVLSTWSTIERAISELSPEDRARLEEEAAPFGKNPRFPGFDGNNESEYMSAASFMIEKMGFYPEMADRSHLNSHMPTLQTFDRMKSTFDEAWKEASYSGLNVDQLIKILNEKRHPDNR